MPLYEYICRNCGKEFSEVLSVKEREKKRPRCPKCESPNVGAIAEPFFAGTARKTRGY